MPANVNNDASNASFCSAYELREKRRPSFDASRSCKVGCEPGPVSRTVAGCAARSCFAHGCGLRGTLLFRTRLRVARRGKLGQAVAGCASRQAWPCGYGLRVAASCAMRLRVARRGKLGQAIDIGAGRVNDYPTSIPMQAAPPTACWLNSISAQSMLPAA